MPVVFLMFATAALFSNGQARADEPANEKQTGPEPRYNVPSDARDPFVRPGAGETGTGGPRRVVITDAGSMTPEDIVALIRLNGVMEPKGGSDSGMAIINGQVHKEGDDIKLDMGALKVEIKLVKLLLNPPSVIISYGGQEYTLTLNPQEEGD
jgi:hypothetical protein